MTLRNQRPASSAANRYSRRRKIKIMKAYPSISLDRSKIVLDGENQLRHWTKHFGVTQQELARAIERVGNSAAAVRKELAFKTAAQSK
jgi:Protein of unknown function (DUF3606)